MYVCSVRLWSLLSYLDRMYLRNVMRNEKPMQIAGTGFIWASVFCLRVFELWSGSETESNRKGLMNRKFRNNKIDKDFGKQCKHPTQQIFSITALNLQSGGGGGFAKKKTTAFFWFCIGLSSWVFGSGGPSPTPIPFCFGMCRLRLIIQGGFVWVCFWLFLGLVSSLGVLHDTLPNDVFQDWLQLWWVVFCLALRDEPGAHPHPKKHPQTK